MFRSLVLDFVKLSLTLLRSGGQNSENQAPDIPFFRESAGALLKLLELPGVPFETLLRAA